MIDSASAAYRDGASYYPCLSDRRESSAASVFVLAARPYSGLRNTCDAPPMRNESVVAFSLGLTDTYIPVIVCTVLHAAYLSFLYAKAKKAGSAVKDLRPA